MKNPLHIALCMLVALVTACQPVTQPPAPTETAAPPVPPIVKNTTTPGETVSFTTEDGLQLSGTMFGKSSATAIVLAHESTSGESRWHPFASYLADQGYVALAFSYRGFGESEGEITQNLVGTDLKAAITFLRERGFKRIICIGASLGGIACGNVSHEPDLVGLVIISSPLGSGAIELTSGDFADLTYPKLFIAGDMDFVSGVTEGVQQMYDWSPEPKQIKIFNSAEHGISFFQSSFANEFTILLTEFIASIPPTSTSVVPDGWQTFTSTRYNYSMKYPSNWLVSEKEGEWDIRKVLYPRESGIDTFSKLKANDLVAVGVQVLTGEIPLDEWTKTNTELINSQLSPCGEPESQAQVSLAGEVAMQLTYHCTDGYYLIWVFTTHSQRGFATLWASRTGNEAADQIMFEQFLSSFAFTD